MSEQAKSVLPVFVRPDASLANGRFLDLDVHVTGMDGPNGVVAFDFLHPTRNTCISAEIKD
jgi:hypothetical protein